MGRGTLNEPPDASMGKLIRPQRSRTTSGKRSGPDTLNGPKAAGRFGQEKLPLSVFDATVRRALATSGS
jgi:hypothetical protein